MRERKRKIELTDREWSVLMNLLMDARNQFIEDNIPTEDVNKLIEKAGKAKPSREEARDSDER